ncbi:MAG: hydrogenase [Oligoflexales bacterium]|nr:hydrogenase [Oligoflexales bacterium]
MIYFLFISPAVFGLFTLVIPSDRYRPYLIPVACITQCILAFMNLRSPVSSFSRWIGLDPFGSIVLVIITFLFLLLSFYIVGYLDFRRERKNRYFCLSVLFLLGMLNLSIVSQHLGLMWIAMESATLSAVPLVYFNKREESLEAVWKYMLIGGVGIAIALMGSFFLVYSAFVESENSTLIYSELLASSNYYSKFWIRVAFVFLFVGYGTKIGLVPMHTWKPDVYGESSGAIGALLAGGVITCAFLALLRVVHIVNMAGEGPYARSLLIFTGIISMALASIFMLDQRDFKRLLAYSSIEHMGILVLGIGIGGPALSATFLHMINNSLTKGVMFLSAGNLHRACKSKSIESVKGMVHVLPFSAIMFIIGFLAITGSPPFGPFLSEFLLTKAFFESGNNLVGVVFLILLFIVFLGMGRTVFYVVFGHPSLKRNEIAPSESLLTTIPILLLALTVLALGIFIPDQIKVMLNDAVKFYGEFR